MWGIRRDAWEQTGASGEMLAWAADSDFSADTETPNHQAELHCPRGFPGDHLGQGWRGISSAFNSHKANQGCL